MHRNFSCKLGEIDLIMRDGNGLQTNILVIVEVRYRRNAKYGGAAASITPAKQRRIVRTTAYFQKTMRGYSDWPVRFDVVTLTGMPDNLQITWLPRAFEC